jgi:hypothetical protein
MKILAKFTATMRNAFLAAVFLLPLSSIRAQLFEGKVTYMFEIRNGDSNNIPDSVFNMMYKDAPNITYTYYYKDNRFKAVTGYNVANIQIYEPSENRIYYYTEGSEVAFWSEWDEETKMEKLDRTETILGIECSGIVLRTKESETTIYHVQKYTLDAPKVKEANTWGKFLEATGSVPLKYIIKGDGAQHITVLTATEITEENLSDEFFKIPKFKHVMKRPF